MGDTSLFFQLTEPVISEAVGAMTHTTKGMNYHEDLVIAQKPFPDEGNHVDKDCVFTYKDQ